jgi:DNA polymerase
MSNPIADHLRFYAELGVTGVSRDAAWRRRETASAPTAAAMPSAHVDDRRASLPTPLEAQPVLGEGFAPADQIPWPEATAATPDEGLRVIRDEIGPACARCKLHALGRRQVVYGVGHPRARLMFVGEAPGEEEDKQGEPFVGRAGQLLTKIIEAIGLARDQVYIANVIKCRPPGNRNPEPDEVATCEGFLFRQIDVIKPMVIVPLGKFAAQSLLKSADPITRLRGRVYQYRGASLIPTFHPAYLLRNPSAKRDVWEDMKKVRAILQGDA